MVDAAIRGLALAAAVCMAVTGVQTILDRSPVMKWKAGRVCVVISGAGVMIDTQAQVNSGFI